MAQRNDSICTEHGRRLDAIRSDLTELGGRMSAAEATQGTLVEGISNFRSFQTDVREFITESRTRDVERGKAQINHEKELKDALALNSELITRRQGRVMMWIAFFGVMFAALTVVLGVLAYLEGHRQLKSGELKLRGDNEPAQVYAARRQLAQDATLPPTYQKRGN